MAATPASYSPWVRLHNGIKQKKIGEPQMRIHIAAAFCLLASAFTMEQQESAMAAIVGRARETYGNFVTCSRKYVVSLREKAHEKYEQAVEWVKCFLRMPVTKEKLHSDIGLEDSRAREEAEEEIRRIIEEIKAKLAAMSPEKLKELEEAGKEAAERPEESSTAAKEL
jgi:hypothetical protein